MIAWAFIIGALSLLLEWKQNMLKAKTTRKVYDNSGNEWDVYGWYLLKNGWEYWQLEPVDANGNMFGLSLIHI